MSNNEKWAIITGASSGIGRALAFEFAAGGFNLLLTARNQTALEEVASQCRAKHGVEVDVVKADLSCPEAVEDLVRTLKESRHSFEVLVNNAGFGIHGEFASTDIEQNIALVNVQVTAALRLTMAVLPDMVAQRKGRVLTVASVYSFSPVPF